MEEAPRLGCAWGRQGTLWTPAGLLTHRAEPDSCLVAGLGGRVRALDHMGLLLLSPLLEWEAWESRTIPI